MRGNRAYKIGDYTEVLKDNGILHNHEVNQLMQFSDPCITCKYLFICAGDCQVFNDSPGSCDRKSKSMVFYDNIMQKLIDYKLGPLTTDESKM